MKFKDRTIYAKLGWDKEAKKKTVYFGGGWGKLDKSEANATAIRTGDGLVVLDVDTKDFSELDKELRKILKGLKPTVESKRGYHYYFKHKKSSEFVNKASYSKLVDVRSDGGIIFNQYLGSNKNIMYKRVGKIYKKMPKELRKYLLKRMSISRDKMKNRVQWERVPNGEIHDTTLAYAMRDFRNGLTVDEVILNGMNYVEKYLGNKPREVKLMLDRIKWGAELYLQEKLKKPKESVSEVVKDDVGGDFSDEEVRELLKKAQKGGALELERTMKEIKKRLNISIGTMREMLKELPEDAEGLGSMFKGEVVWATNLGVFTEILNGKVIYYNKQNFVQTCVSKSGYMSTTDVNERLCSIPAKIVEYNPTKRDGRDGFDEFGNPTINTYSGNAEMFECVEGGCKKIPKTISKVLDNLFLSDLKAKEYFLHWLAYIVQTGKRTGVAWVFYGASGSGKGLIVDVIAHILRYENCSLNVGDSDLQSNFNSYVHNTQFLHLNEIASDFHGRHGVAGKMKAYVADPVLRLNMKNMPEIPIDNYVNIIINSNKANPIEVDKDDRRYNMVVSNKPLTANKWWKGDKSYKKAIKEFKEFGKYLMNFEVDEIKATRPMEVSDAKQKVIEQTSNDLDLLGDAISRGDLESIIELLDIDESDFDITIKEVREAVSSCRWSNNLLKRVYLHITGKSFSRPSEYKKYFVKPFIKGYKLSIWKISKSITVRGIELQNVNLKE